MSLTTRIMHLLDMKMKATEGTERPERPTPARGRTVPELTHVAKCCGLYLCESRETCVRLGTWSTAGAAEPESGSPEAERDERP